jgi:hypothetical protein
MFDMYFSGVSCLQPSQSVSRYLAHINVTLFAGRLKIDVAQLEGGGGRGIVAKEDLEPGEVLLSVPFTTVFEDDEVML